MWLKIEVKLLEMVRQVLKWYVQDVIWTTMFSVIAELRRYTVSIVEVTLMLQDSAKPQTKTTTSYNWQKGEVEEEANKANDGKKKEERKGIKKINLAKVENP